MIDFFKVDQTAGTVVSSATFSVPLPAGYTGAKNGAEIEIAPSGSVLYVSMRLDSVAQGSIVAYSIDAHHRGPDGDRAGQLAWYHPTAIQPVRRRTAAGGREPDFEHDRFVPCRSRRVEPSPS